MLASGCCEEISIKANLLEILTGEGKSLVIALSSAARAI
jgi:hypothetical protein